MDTEYDVIVVGGGASGMMAAGRAAELGKRVLLIEKNKRLGEKLRISGGGRCNITNAEFDAQLLLARYGASQKFLHSSFNSFGVKETMEFFESHDLPLVVEARKRVFPASQDANHVVNVLQSYMKQGGVDIKTASTITKVVVKNSSIESLVSDEQSYTAKKYIFATGGVSHPETGSTGDGFAWLKNLGHTVVAPTPSIVPLAVKDDWIKQLAGITLKDCRMTLYLEGKKQFRLDGDILCTHFGVSGPLILNNAHKVADLLLVGDVTATIDVMPRYDIGSLDTRCIEIMDANKNKELKNVVGLLLPAGMQKGFLNLVESFISPDTKVHSVSRDQRKKMVSYMKAMPLTIEGLLGFDKAVVADGGVPLEEIDTRTFKSLKCDNLYITGDLLHIRRPSGGFSLQLCWTSGYIAGGATD